MTLELVEARPFTPISHVSLSFEGPDGLGSHVAFLQNLDPQGYYNVALAYSIAMGAHSKDNRASGEPFVTHPLRATRYLIQAGCTHAAHICACLLHDVPEDTQYLSQVGAEYYTSGASLRDLRETLFYRLDGSIDPIERLAFLFDRETASIVEGLNKPTGKRNKYQAERAYQKQLATSHPRVGLVKMPDRLDNLTTFGPLSRERQERKIRETKEGFLPTFERSAAAFSGEGPVLLGWVKAAITAWEA